jgi:uridine kinase
MPAERCLLVGISGIDASGKGFTSRKLSRELRSMGYRVALINVDGWLNLPAVRFSEYDPGAHFYQYGIRLEEMFERLIEPLKRDRTVDLQMDYMEQMASEYRPHRYSFSDIDIILLEGIFIFKRRFVDLFDLRIWLDCNFEVALERAVARGQEALSPAETIRAYKNIYFPAQQHHLATDSPIENSIVSGNHENDPRD